MKSQFTLKKEVICLLIHKLQKKRDFFVKVLKKVPKIAFC